MGIACKVELVINGIRHLPTNPNKIMSAPAKIFRILPESDPSTSPLVHYAERTEDRTRIESGTGESPLLATHYHYHYNRRIIKPDSQRAQFPVTNAWNVYHSFNNFTGRTTI